MGEKTGISWTQRTQNFWRGCTRISPGCKNCYMFEEQSRYKLDPSVVVRTKTWGNPKRWNKEAEREGKRFLVFTCSWSDFFHADADQWRQEAWRVIKETPNLIYQILTKREDRIVDHLPADWGDGYDNVWLGVSIESNKYVYRADVLRKAPARIKFISGEPLLGPCPDLNLKGIDWLIVGGESGPNYRPMDKAWAVELRDRAIANGTKFFYKQSAARLPEQDPYLEGRRWEEFPDNVEYRTTLKPLPMAET